MRTFVGLAIVLAVIYGIDWVLKQVKRSKEDRGAGHGLETTAVVALGPNRSLHLVRAGRELVLVGVAEHGVTPIRTYSEDEAIDARPHRRGRRRAVDADAARGRTVARRRRALAGPPQGPDGAAMKGPDGTNAVQLLLLVGGLTLIPALLFCVTAFTRIIIVLGFIRQGLGTPSAPPNQVLVGIALFLTIFVMAPDLHADQEGRHRPAARSTRSRRTQAFKRGQEPLREFMFHQTRTTDLALFVKLGKIEDVKTRKDVPTYVLIPAFIISELKTAFQIGFLIFLPFLVIDLVVSSTLMSMGMVMLPPVFISLPFKILLFVLVDGWNLVTRSLVESFH